MGVVRKKGRRRRGREGRVALAIGKIDDVTAVGQLNFQFQSPRAGLCGRARRAASMNTSVNVTLNTQPKHIIHTQHPMNPDMRPVYNRVR